MEIWTNPYRRRWLGWGLLVSAFFLVSLHRLSTAVISEQLMRSFDTTGASLGLLHSSFFYLYAVMQIPAGVLADKFGARRMATYGTLAMSAGAVVFGLAPVYGAAFFGRLLVGLGGSVIFVAILRFAANWYRPDEFATISGVTFTAAVLGGMAASTPLAVLAAATGWRPSMVILGVVGFAVAAGIFLASHNTPENAGLPAIENVPSSPTQSFADLKRHLRRALSEREIWIVSVMMFFMTGTGITIVGLWAVPFMVQLYDISVTEASVYIFVGTAGGLAGPTVFGWLSDRLGRRTELVVFSVVVFAVSWAIIAALGTPPLLVIGGILFFSRLLRGGTPLVFTVMKEQYPEEASGTIIGLTNTAGWIGAAVFPVLMGVVLDIYWTGETVNGVRVYTEVGYRIGFAMAVGAGLIATVCAVWLHYRVNRPGDRPTTARADAPEV